MNVIIPVSHIFMLGASVITLELNLKEKIELTKELFFSILDIESNVLGKLIICKKIYTLLRVDEKTKIRKWMRVAVKINKLINKSNVRVTLEREKKK